jgi:hypothetical protein
MIMSFNRRIFLGGSALVMIAITLLIYVSAPRKLSQVQPSKPVPSSVVQPFSPTQQYEKSPPGVKKQPVIDWNKEFKSSSDYFPLIAKAGKAALNGDGRAAHYVSLRLGDCLLMARMYGSAVDPKATLEQEIAARIGQSPPEFADMERRQLEACAGFYKVNDVNGNDVFEDLPKREGGYRSKQFWRDLAYQNNDPVAEADHAALSMTNATSPKPDEIKIAQVDVNNAIVSGDPEAIYRAGTFITSGPHSDQIQGFALSLAACDLGYDCTAQNSTNTDFPFGACVSMGTCSPGETFSDWVTKNIGADGYAKAYARAQQIKAALAQGDTSALQQFAQLKQ